MKRALIIGCPGGGKSTFAKALHQAVRLPLYHLDLLFWKSDATCESKAVFLQKMEEILKKDRWIIDGNYQSTMERRMEFCDTIFFLDYSLETCLDGIAQRHGKPRDDLPWIEQHEDPEFLQFIRNFETEKRPQILALLENYKGKEIHIFHNRKEADLFIEGLKKEM